MDYFCEYELNFFILFQYFFFVNWRKKCYHKSSVVCLKSLNDKTRYLSKCFSVSTINTFKSRKDADKALFITIWILSSYFYGRTQEDNGIAKWSFSQGKVLATRTFRTILQHKLFWNITGFWFHLSKIGFFFLSYHQ